MENDLAAQWVSTVETFLVYADTVVGKKNGWLNGFVEKVSEHPRISEFWPCYSLGRLCISTAATSLPFIEIRQPNADEVYISLLDEKGKVLKCKKQGGLQGLQRKLRKFSSIFLAIQNFPLLVRTSPIVLEKKNKWARVRQRKPG